MAALLTNHKTPTERTMPDLFMFDSALLASPEGQKAYHAGLLRAKQEALYAARQLVQVGRPLFVAVLAVSFLHVFHTIAQIAPADIPAIQLPNWLYYLTAALLTLAIDAIALYCVSVKSVSAYAGNTQRQRLVWFFYVLTALLNGMFFLAYLPGLPAWTDGVATIFRLVIAILLTLLVPISIMAVETAHKTVDATRLALLIEVSTLQGIVQADQAAKEQSAHPVATPHQSVETASAPRPLPDNNTPPPVAANRTCKYCGVSGLTQIDLLAHGRAYKRAGQCPPAS
jgi:hypothetical protein